MNNKEKTRVVKIMLDLIHHEISITDAVKELEKMEE